MFTIGNQLFNYHVHLYNTPRINERAVEVPVAMRLLNWFPNALEIGAVTPHYLYHQHEVIDLYEEFPGVINADVLDYQPRQESYDLVFSISTLDHLLNADQVRKAVARMKSWTSPEGFLYLTLPFGQPGGPWLDDLVLSGALDMQVLRMDKVDPEWHTWKQVDLDEPLRAYGGLSSWANSVFLLFYPHCPFPAENSFLNSTVPTIIKSAALPLPLTPVQ